MRSLPSDADECLCSLSGCVLCDKIYFYIIKNILTGVPRGGLLDLQRQFYATFTFIPTIHLIE